ncbi:MAG TPA: hypothetical protein VGH98_12575 [Gemmatimonadaceae bacterium]|jgi:hypothetical protein
MPRLSTAVAAAVTLLVPIAPARSQTASGASRVSVPVKGVVLFSSGVGYYEHDGTVHGDAMTELRFKTDQINDVLKSLVLQDRDGGHVGAVTYPSQAPISRTLKSFQVDITSNPSLADLLNQLRGARVTVQQGTEHISGTVLGVESRNKAVGTERIVVPTLDLVANGTIRAVELPTISGLALDDPQLQEELAKALAALAQARDQDKKPVTVDFSGTGDRRVRIGYVVEAPEWKTSYRLLLGDNHSQLQGWAIVENQTESDWNDISLSLVSGRPISFIMDLYQPLYATRPTVVPKLFAGLHPQLYENGASTLVDSVALRPAQALTPGSRAANPAITIRGASTLRLDEVVVTGMPPSDYADNESVQAIAQSADLGELFEYSVGNVTLARQKSAMLPIIVDSVCVQRVSIFKQSVLARNALTGARLTNSTGKLLLQGPITVLDHNTYSGDARIDDVPSGQQRLLSYGVDLQLTVDVSDDHTDRVVTRKIVKGVLESDTKQLHTRSYRARNTSDHDKTLIVEHPHRPGFTLVETQKPIETLPGLYRFEGIAPAGKVATFTVKEEFIASSTVSLLGADFGPLLLAWRSGELPSDVRDALARAAQFRQELTETERQIADRTQRLAVITQEQARIREDMKTVSPNTPYYARLLAKLNDQESEIEKLQRDREELGARRDVQRKDLDDYVRNLDVG